MIQICFSESVKNYLFFSYIFGNVNDSKILYFGDDLSFGNIQDIKKGRITEENYIFEGDTSIICKIHRYKDEFFNTIQNSCNTGEEVNIWYTDNNVELIDLYFVIFHLYKLNFNGIVCKVHYDMSANNGTLEVEDIAYLLSSKIQIDLEEQKEMFDEWFKALTIKEGIRKVNGRNIRVYADNFYDKDILEYIDKSGTSKNEIIEKCYNNGYAGSIGFINYRITYLLKTFAIRMEKNDIYYKYKS